MTIINLVYRQLKKSLVLSNKEICKKNKKNYIQNSLKNKQYNYNKNITRKNHTFSQPIFAGGPGGGNNGPNKFSFMFLLTAATGVYISRYYNDPRPPTSAFTF
jgi:hypothetical protein